MIRYAKLSEIPEILSMTNACRLHMESQQIFQWTLDYPSKDNFIADIEREELFVLVQEQKLLGCIVISTLMDDEYKPIPWLTPNTTNIYVHRLCIHPESQGKGYAQKLMDFAESNARKKGCSSIRLDTFSKNKRNQKFYECRGYQKLENIYFLNQSQHPFHCYELVL